MSPVLRARTVVAPRHLDDKLSLYADRSLPAATLLACDQHVSICPGCRAAADAERRMLRSLRSAATPRLSSRLESALLDLALHDAPHATTTEPAPLQVMARSAPAMYRSPLRATMLACLVAGASAAAAWSLSANVAGPAGESMQVVRLPASSATAGWTTIGDASSGRAASFLSANHVAGSTGLTATFTAASTQSVPVAPAVPSVPNRSQRSTQSFHE